jgi:hypothetical protein
MIIEIRNEYRIAQVNHFAARAGQTPEEYVLDAIDRMIAADEHAYGNFTTLNEEMESRSEPAAA